MAQLLASDGTTGDYFGISITIYNNLIAVGAVWDDTTTGGWGAGK